MSEQTFVVIQDDVVVAYAATQSDALAAASALAEKQKMRLMLNKRLLKKLLKTNMPLNTSHFKIAILTDKGVNL